MRLSAAFVAGLEKQARVTTPLQPHQQRVVDRLRQPDQPGLVAVHGLGSGKTLTAIAAQEALQRSADVVVPAALRENYLKEQAKHTDKAPPTKMHSLEMTARGGGASLKNPMLVVDEAHRTRNPGKTQQALKKSKADKRLLLTGSLVYNHPADMSAPINIAAGEDLLPTDQQGFAKKYIKEYDKKPGVVGRIMGHRPEHVVEVNQKHKAELRGILDKWVDYYPGSTENFPEVSEETVRVPMGQHQREIDDTLMSKAPAWVRHKVRQGLPPTKKELSQMNSFLTGARQVANTSAPFDKDEERHEDPKIQMAIQRLKANLDANPQGRAVVYSNFLGAGVNPYRQHLDEMKIPYGVFTGDQTPTIREQYVRDYNEGKLKALLLSSAGGEGLDLKNTSLVQLLEPHWNAERGKQVQGRAIRYKSHESLPKDKRKVLVERYVSTRPKSGVLERAGLRNPGLSVDEYLTDMSQRKEQLNQKFRDLLKDRRTKAEKEPSR